MSYNDILMHIDYSVGFEKRIDAAMTFAGRHNSRLHAVYPIAIDPAFFYAFPDSSTPVDVIESFHRRELERADQIKSTFENSARKKNVSVTWLQKDQPDLDLFFQQVCYVDLAIVSQPSSEVGYYTSKFFVNNIVLGGGVPVLVLPKEGWPHTIGDRILVAWTEKREALRALNDALPLIKTADRVDIATVGDHHNQDHGNQDDVHLAPQHCHERLQRHGVDANIHTVGAVKHAEGEPLLKLADQCHSNLIVMGAWGHTRVQEAMLGGVTRTVLNKMTRPVWLSH